MNNAVRHLGTIAARLLVVVFFLATLAAFWFFMAVAALSGGNGTLAAISAGCFLLAILELVLFRRLFRRRGGYTQP
jgi:membrane protein implicated in regulation of membrane protease activity